MYTKTIKGTEQEKELIIDAETLSQLIHQSKLVGIQEGKIEEISAFASSK